MPDRSRLAAPGPSVARLIATAFLPFAAGYFLSYLYRTVNVVIGPNLAADFAVDAAALGVLTSAYFAAFAMFQVPLGPLLDRFGPRRVEAALLLFAALGAVVFAWADTLGWLVVGRGLIGLGVSSCLMAAFKANVMFWPKERLPLINGCFVAVGGLGAAVATAPVEALLGVMSWRTIFLLVAGLTLGVSALILLVVPERPQAAAGSVRDQVTGMLGVLRDRTFWRFAPLTVAGQATLLAYHGLWAGPWLRDVAGYDRSAIAEIMFLVSLALIPGFIGSGLIAERLTRAGSAPHVVFAGLVGLSILAQVPLALGWAAVGPLMWVLFGLLNTSSILSYAMLSQRFPAQLAGRLNASMNLLTFIGAFAAHQPLSSRTGTLCARRPRHGVSGHPRHRGRGLAVAGLAAAYMTPGSCRSVRLL
jgi:predicted MFS family arabinose efflux permease